MLGYYNESYPINSIVFPELWPDFLVMPDEAFTPQYAELLAAHLPEELSPTPTPTSMPSPEASDETEEPADNSPKITRKQLIIPLTAAVLIIILITFYLLIFERAYRRGRR